MNKLPFPTTQEQISKLPDILDEMLLADIAPDFAEKVIALAAECQGMFDQVEMWSHADTDEERESCLVYINKTLQDWEL